MANQLMKTAVLKDGATFTVPGYPDLTIRLGVTRATKRSGNRSLMNVVSNLGISAQDVLVDDVTEALAVSKRISGSAENGTKKAALLAIHDKVSAAISEHLSQGYLLDGPITVDIAAELAKLYPAKA